MSGEKLSADISGIVTFQTKINEIILKERLTSDQIFIVGKTGLNFLMLPSKTLAAKSEKTAPGFKKSKERVTVLANLQCIWIFKASALTYRKVVKSQGVHKHKQG